MEFNPKYYRSPSSGDLEWNLRKEAKDIRWTRRQLRTYGVDRATANLLIGDGYRGDREIYDATEHMLLSIKGIGRKRLARIRAVLLPHFLRVI